MARLSGLPSEHHHEGPGDAPRRKRGRPTKTLGQVPEDMSSTGKRTASPTAELSQTKRTKRVQVDDEEQIAEEMRQSFSRSQRDDTIHVSTQPTRRNNRRHSEPPVAADNEDDDFSANPVSATQPLPGLTPHLDRVGASRSRFTNTRRSRASMPAQFHVERVDEVDETDGNHVQFAPLTQVLDGRARRRLRRSHLSQEVNDFEDHQKQDKKMFLELHRQLKARDEKIKDLEYRLEAHRLGDIDITDAHAQELEEELEEARNQIDELRGSTLYNGSEHDVAEMSEDEDDGLVLVNPDELNMSQDLDLVPTPNGKYSSRALELASQTLSQLNRDSLTEGEDTMLLEKFDKIEDQAVARYERELQEYSRALGESQGALRVINIEIQNLHFLSAGAVTTDILTEMRHSFDNLRAEIEKFFPGTTTGLTNQELLNKVPELLGGVFIELKEKVTALNSSHKTEVLLRRQYEGVLDVLGESENRNKQLEADVFTLDKSNEDKQRIIQDLEERKAALTGLSKDQEMRLRENDIQITNLQADNEEKQQSIDLLEDALAQYKEDLENVTISATKFETDHNELIARMEEEHALAIDNLETERAAEQEGREAAEADAQQKDNIIEDLEARLAAMEDELDGYTADVEAIRKRLDEQTEARTLAEGERDEQAEVAYQRDIMIENLNETIVELKEQIASYKDDLSREHDQRAKNEADLEEANDKIQDLSVRLHDTGIQANELRSKLFQLQQEKEAAIAELQEDAQDRENELNDQLAAEVELRETAENNIVLLKQQIEDLQHDLATVDANLLNMTEARNELEQDRDVQVTNLSSQLADLKAKYAALENSTNSTITSLQANITDLTNQVQRQQADIENLLEEIAEKDRAYLEDTTALKEKNAALEEDVTTLQAENEKCYREIDSLSKRVEDTATEMLNIVGLHNDETESYKSAISALQATVKAQEDAAVERATEHKEELEERATEITELRLMGDARAEEIVALEVQITEMKEAFSKAEEDTRNTIDALLLSQRQLQDQNERLADDLKRRNQEALQAVQEMKLKRIEVKTQGADLHRVVHGKVGKISEKVKVGKKGKKKVTKRQWDSGFGVDDTVEDDELNGDEPLAA